MIKINDNVIRYILEHAKAEHPNECCGLVVVTDGEQYYLPMVNVHEQPEEHFRFDKDQYLAAMQEHDVIAIIHSHTGDGASTVPSLADRSSCNHTGIPHGIASWPEGDFNIIEPVEDLPLKGRHFVLGSDDCYGLVIAWHKQQGVDLMDFRVPYEWWERGERLFSPENFEKAGFYPCEPCAGAMIVAQVMADVPNHCGVLVGDGTILHHLYGRLSGTEQYNGSWIQERTVYCVRHKDLPAPEELKAWQ